MKYLTKQEVADILRVSVRTISDYMSKGLLPAHKKLGRRLLWVESDVFQCVQMSSAQSQPQPQLERGLAKRGRPRKLIL